MTGRERGVEGLSTDDQDVRREDKRTLAPNARLQDVLGQDSGQEQSQCHRREWSRSASSDRDDCGQRQPQFSPLSDGAEEPHQAVRSWKSMGHDPGADKVIGIRHGGKPRHGVQQCIGR